MPAIVIFLRALLPIACVVVWAVSVLTVMAFNRSRPVPIAATAG